MAPFHKREFLQTSLKLWFQEEKRNFPWRDDPTPYKVWISEVMLQQTQAAVVVPYFEKWMARFPTIQALAGASIDEVIKLWEGLGYYSRARFLHEGARYLVANHQGLIPETKEALGQVKGIGPYTTGAILSFAFHKKAAAVDGNVTRVMSRLFCIDKGIGQEVETLLSEDEPWVMMEALIELGAVVCTRTPRCANCPVQEGCLAYQKGKIEEFPKKKSRAEITALRRIVPLINYQENILIQRQEGRKVMAGLYEFPYFEDNESLQRFYPGKLHLQRTLNPVSHTFTRYKAELFPTLWTAEEKYTPQGYIWCQRQSLFDLPFSSGHRKILNQLEEYVHLTHDSS